MEEFDLFNVPINTWFNKIDGTTSSDKMKKRLKNISGNIFRRTWILFKSQGKIRSKRKCNASFSTEKTGTLCVG